MVRVKNMFNNGSCPSSFYVKSFGAGGALHADFKTFGVLVQRRRRMLVIVGILQIIGKLHGNYVGLLADSADSWSPLR